MITTAHKVCQTAKPDILSVLEREAIALTQRGRYFWACCPFHTEKTPSFKVDHYRQNFFCFGCYRRGDVIALVRELHSLSFKGALAYLDIEVGRPDPVWIAENKEKKKLVENFRAWERETVTEIAEVLRAFYRLKATRTVFTIAELITLAELQGNIDILEYHYQILCGRDDRAKYALFREELDAG